MSQNQNEHSPDDLLERSLGEMRREALPDGPPDDLVLKTLAALRSAESEQDSASGVGVWRSEKKNPLPESRTPKAETPDSIPCNLKETTQ